MSYMNRPHSAELTQSLKDHGMDIKRPSQLSDAFRLGWWASEKNSAKQRNELLAALQKAKATLESIEDDVMSLEFATARWRAGQGARDAKASISRALGENKE